LEDDPDLSGVFPFDAGTGAHHATASTLERRSGIETEAFRLVIDLQGLARSGIAKRDNEP